MYGWQRYLSIEQEFKQIRQYVSLDLENTYSEFFTRSVIILGAEIEASFKILCRQTSCTEPRGNIGDFKNIILNHFPGIIHWKCIIKGENKQILPFENWDIGKLCWWDTYTNIKHNLVDEKATYKIALKMLAAYQLLLFLIEATDPERENVVSVDKAIGGNVLNETVDGGLKAYTIVEMPDYLVPDIDFGIGDGINGLPGIAFYPEDILEKIQVQNCKAESYKPCTELNDKTILITGSPGFIGANLVLRLLTTLVPCTFKEMLRMLRKYYSMLSNTKILTDDFLESKIHILE